MVRDLASLRRVDIRTSAMWPQPRIAMVNIALPLIISDVGLRMPSPTSPSARDMTVIETLTGVTTDMPEATTRTIHLRPDLPVTFTESGTGRPTLILHGG